LDLDKTPLLLKKVFGEHNVIPEWNVAISKDTLPKNLRYCPRINFAIGPFNIDGNFGYNIEQINKRYFIFESLIRFLRNEGLASSQWRTNVNPSCFCAIEYEDKTSTKHRMGSLVNVGAIGKVGIIVAKNIEVFRSYRRMQNYIEFLQQNKKVGLELNNIIITEKEKFENALRRY
jgi:hypothetical protein